MVDVIAADSAATIVLGLLFFALMVGGLWAALRVYFAKRAVHAQHIAAGHKHALDCSLCKGRWGNRLAKMVAKEEEPKESKSP